ncbi:MAG TPA: helix-turn-helix domain-containing protein [Solirubrobacterales bacterium]|nr:helix-turn-helix domain-containing protein [Solirubrobacterales bacterium]
MHRIVALCLDGVVAFDLTAAAQVFGVASERDGTPLYEVSTCTEGGAEVATTTGFGLRPQHDLGALEGADTVVVPGYFAVLDPPPAPVTEALQHASARGARVLSVCTGAFALAHAGLLDGRRATTHWAHAEQLSSRFPAVEVDPAALYVDEGEVMTSAGLSAGIDLSLHVVRKDFGAVAGETVARRMVAAPHREGGQAQFIKRPPLGEPGTLETTRRWALERLADPLDVAAMARHASVSPRTFARRFREETGTTPLRWLLAQRVLEARRLLEESDLPIDEVAWQAGFGTAASLREHFRRATATTPTAYRRSFQPAPPGGRGGNDSVTRHDRRSGSLPARR